MKPFLRFLLWWFGIIAALALIGVILWGVVSIMDCLISRFGRETIFVLTMFAFTAVMAFFLRNMKLP